MAVAVVRTHWEDLRVWRAVGLGAAVLAAVAGVVWYAVAPGVGTFQASGWLTAPALIIVLVWLHRRLPLRVQWALALAIALVGPVGYLLWGGSQWWNWGQLTPLPVVLLAMRKSFEDDDDELQPHYGGMAGGPWGPP
jgi:hypothetical protein